MELDYNELSDLEDQTEGVSSSDATRPTGGPDGMSGRSRGFPGKVAIRHVVEAARSCGINVQSIEVTPSAIRVSSVAAPSDAKESDFDRLNRLGAL